jgi:hypothetical protein
MERPCPSLAFSFVRTPALIMAKHRDARRRIAKNAAMSETVRDVDVIFTPWIFLISRVNRTSMSQNG